MFEIQTSIEFSAAHSLRDYDGPCARNHGHNYRLEIVVRAERLNDQKMVMDFAEMDRMLAGVIEPVDHQNLNEIPPFDRINPTAEAIAEWFFGELKSAITKSTGGRAGLARIRLWETPEACVTYSEEIASDR